MDKSKLFRTAHKNTREVKKVHLVDYNAQFGIELSMLYQLEKMNKKVKFDNYNLQGSAKQIKWANDILNQNVWKMELLDSIQFENSGYSRLEKFERAKNNMIAIWNHICNLHSSNIIENRYNLEKYSYNFLYEFKEDYMKKNNIEKCSIARLNKRLTELAYKQYEQEKQEEQEEQKESTKEEMI